MADTVSKLDLALGYARRGWHVLPLVGKAPRVSGGCNSATVDEAVIRQWFEQWPDADIGIAPRPSGFMVLDVDPRNGGEQTFTSLRAAQEIPETLGVRTGGGGMHLYFKSPGVPLKGKLGDGIDVKDLGYVVAPGSIHPETSQRYEWISDPDESEIAELPDGILSKLVKATVATPEARPSNVTAYGKGALNKAVRAVSNAAAGERNNTVNREAYGIGQLVGAGVLDLTEALDELLAAALAIGLPDTEARTAVQNGLNAGVQHPRQIRQPSSPRPVVWIPPGSDLSQQADAIVQALVTANDPPFIFRQAGRPVAVIRIDSQPMILRLESSAQLRTFVTDRFQFLTEKLTKEGTSERKYQTVSKELAEYILQRPELPFPELEGVAYCPLLARDGRIYLTEGYVPDLKTYLFLDGLDLGEPPSVPTDQDVDSAKDVLKELFGDFPFLDEPSLAHAFGAAVLPIVRPCLEGQTPLLLIGAPLQGSGKTLLAGSLSILGTGREPVLLHEIRSEEEMVKTVIAALSEGATVMLFDNLNHRIDHGPLAATITAKKLTARKLQHTAMVTVTNRAIWLATANNPQMSGEMARRACLISLDPAMEKPWLRTGFRHSPLLPWVQLNRARLLSACLLLVQNWVAVGRPKTSKTLGSFEEWAEVIGGILEAARISGFLENLQALERQVDSELAEWSDFLAFWWAMYNTNPVGVRELFQLVQTHDLLPNTLGDGREASQRIRLGKAIGRRLNRVIGGFKISPSLWDACRKAGLYVLANVTTGQTGSAPEFQTPLPGSLPPGQETAVTPSSGSGAGSPEVDAPDTAVAATLDLIDAVWVQDRQKVAGLTGSFNSGLPVNEAETRSSSANLLAGSPTEAAYQPLGLPLDFRNADRPEEPRELDRDQMWG
jgi:hypothetical protein